MKDEKAAISESLSNVKSLRVTELEQINSILCNEDLRIKEIISDGHCLYRLVSLMRFMHITSIMLLHWCRSIADQLLLNSADLSSEDDCVSLLREQSSADQVKQLRLWTAQEMLLH